MKIENMLKNSFCFEMFIIVIVDGEFKKLLKFLKFFFLDGRDKKCVDIFKSIIKGDEN